MALSWGEKVVFLFLLWWFAGFFWGSNWCDWLSTSGMVYCISPLVHFHKICYQTNSSNILSVGIWRRFGARFGLASIICNGCRMEWCSDNHIFQGFQRHSEWNLPIWSMCIGGKCIQVCFLQMSRCMQIYIFTLKIMYTICNLKKRSMQLSSR